MKNKVISFFLACITCIALCIPQDVFASSQALITLSEVEAETPSGYVRVKADLVVDDGSSTIVDIKNTYVSGHRVSVRENMVKYDIESVACDSGSIWSGGSFATVTVTYRVGTELRTEVWIFYP